MSKHLDRIRSQPDHIRHIWAGLCTLVVGALVVSIWFHSFHTTAYALLNPDQAQQDGNAPIFASQNQSLFASIAQTLKDGTAAIGQVWSALRDTQPVRVQNNQPAADGGQAYPLPVSGNK